MAKALIVRTNGTVEQTNIGEGSYNIISETVGGIFDSVSNNHLDIVGYVHDSGLLIGLEPNPMGCGLFGHIIVGDIVVSKTDAEGETIDLDDSYFGSNFAKLASVLNTDEELKKDLAVIRDQRAKEPMKIYGLNF